MSGWLALALISGWAARQPEPEPAPAPQAVESAEGDAARRPAAEASRTGAEPSTPPTEPSPPDPESQSAPPPGPESQSAPPPVVDDDARENPTSPDPELPASSTSSRSVWRTTEPATKPNESPPAPRMRGGVAPGGYWDPGEAPEIAPKDGYEQRLAGYIVLPLGALTTASGAAMVYLTYPGKCVERTSQLGYDYDADDCRGLLILNSIRVGYGAAAIITGAVLLAIGHKRKKDLERWKRRRFRASIAPGAGRGRAVSAQFSFRF